MTSFQGFFQFSILFRQGICTQTIDFFYWEKFFLYKKEEEDPKERLAYVKKNFTDGSSALVFDFLLRVAV